NEKMYALAQEIKQKFYGNRIVMFAPLYLSNYCVNGCTYCPYHQKNKHIRRKQLSQEESSRKSLHCRTWDTSVWRWKPEKIRSVAPLNMCWRVLRPSTLSNIKMEPFAALMSTSLPQR